MSMKKDKKTSLAGLFGRTRRSIMALLYGHPDESYYLRQILRITDIAPGAGQRELSWLSDAGIITRQVRGNQVHYQANAECPIFSELRSLMTKTAGIGDILRASLAQVKDRLSLALLYGSVAQGVETKDSDIDLIVVGNVTFAEIVQLINPTQEILGREINPSVYGLEEFRKKVADGHHFLNSVLGDDVIYVIGDKGELKRLAGQRMAG